MGSPTEGVAHWRTKPRRESGERKKREQRGLARSDH